MSIQFVVYGVPQPAGSKRAFAHAKTGRIVVTDAAKNSRPWKQQVAGEAARVMGHREPFTDPLEVLLTFAIARPKSHYRAGANSGQLRDSAPHWCAKRPDIDKLSRSVLDALTGIVWRDDAQVAVKTASKCYGSRPGVAVTVCALADLPPGGILA